MQWHGSICSGVTSNNESNSFELLDVKTGRTVNDIDGRKARKVALACPTSESLYDTTEKSREAWSLLKQTIGYHNE